MIESRIEPSDLKIGDILLIIDKKNQISRHIAVVAYVDLQERIYKILHFRSLSEPFGLTETALLSFEALNDPDRNWEYECYRLIEEKQTIRAVEILKEWLKWAVPYDKNRFEKAKSSVNKYFKFFSDNPELVPPLLDEKYSKDLELHRQEMEQLFLENYMDIVKYAARRDISPVRPKPDTEKQTGFNCFQGILLAFQVAYAEDIVESESKQWLTNKYVLTNGTLDNKAPRFESAYKALKPKAKEPNFDLKKFFSSFPLAFRLDAKRSAIDTFRHAMRSDEKIIYLGLLKPLTEAETNPDKKTRQTICLALKEQGIYKRKKLLEEVVMPSIISSQIQKSHN